MKKVLSIIAVLLVSLTTLAQNSVRIIPNRTNVCENTTISIQSPGNSFHPQTYLWSTGATTPSIVINQSGTYTCTVAGFGPNTFNVRVVTVSRTYTILPKPTINVINGPWVCRFDTVQLSATQGYNNYTWNDGSTLQTYSSVRDSIYPGPQLDTTSVWYTAGIPGVCTLNSDTIVIRGVRAPNGVGSFYCGKLDIDPNGQIPAGLVLDYLYPTQYEMEFTQLSNPANTFAYFPPIGSRYAPANLLIPGEQYSVRTRVIINGQTFCWGIPCTIAVQSANRVSLVKSYNIYTVDGRLVKTLTTSDFDKSLLSDLTSGYYIVTVVTNGYVDRFVINNN